MNKLKIGIIGCGFIGMGKHLPGLAKQKDKVELAAFCDLIPERAESAAAKYGGEGACVTTDWHKLMEDSTLDIIHVCTPNVTHCELTCAALEAGKHVMCEKPMAVTGADAKKMVDTARRCGKKLTVGYQNRFRDDAIYLRRLVDNGRLGDIYYAQANAKRRRCVPTWGVFMDKSKQGGGPLIDLGTHALDLTLWYMGNYDVASVTGSVFYKMGDKTEGNLCGEWKPEEYTVEDSAFGFIRMKNGATIELGASWVLNIMEPREACTTLCGTEGGAEMRHNGEDHECLINYAEGGRLVDATVDFKQKIVFGPESADATPGDREAAQWIDAIINDHEPVVLPEQAMVVTQILEAIYKSGESGEMVRF